MTAHLRALRRNLNALDTSQLPTIWPERINTHIRSINTNLEPAITQLAYLAHTPPQPDHARAHTDDERHHTGDRRPSPVEAAARLATGPQRIIDQIDNDLTIGLAHLRIATATSRSHDHCRLAWQHLGDARSSIEKHAGITYRSSLICACGGLDGYLEWGNQLCDNVAATDRAGLCIPCSLKRDAWRKRRDYRERGRADRRQPTPA